MSNNNFNKTFQQSMVAGRLAKDPIFKILPSGTQVCNFGLVVGDDNGGSDYIPCVAWANKAKVIADNLSKGSLILCEGKMKSSSYEDSEGRKRFELQYELLNHGKLIFMESKKVDTSDLDELPQAFEGDQT